jgi:ribosomal-protein-alanine N-acetyltransferase
MLGAPRNEWDEGPWRESELTSVKFRELLRAEEKLRKTDRQYSFGIFRRDDGVLVGHVYLMDISRGVFQNAYVGYRIFNPFWGQGYATAALKLSAQIAFKKLKLHRIEAGISPENEASLQVALNAGLRCEGLSRKRLLVDRKWVDLLIFATTAEDFRGRSRK